MDIPTPRFSEAFVTTGTTASQSISLPGGCQPGEYAVYEVTINAGAAITITSPPSGWTELVPLTANSSGTDECIVYGKELTAADISAGSVATGISAARAMVSTMLVFPNAQVESATGWTDQNGVSTSTIPAVTPLTQGGVWLAIVSSAASAVNSARAYSPSAGWTEQADRWNTSTTGRRVGNGMFTRPLTSYGSSTGTSTATETGGTVQSLTASILLIPKPGANFFGHM